MSNINNSESDSDYIEDLASFHGENLDAGERLEMVRSVSASVHDNPDNNVLTRLSTLTQQLSHLNARQMSKFDLSEEDFDLQRILHYMEASTLEQGVSQKHTGVEFQNVSVFGVDESTSIVPTVGDVFLAPYYIPKKLIFGDKTAQALKKKGDDKLRKIVQNININVNAGEMCLVLGRPGAGCSSFLKTIAGETDLFVKVEGDISYNGIPQDEMMKSFKRDVIYNPELDVHFPHLTVSQTLEFAIGCRTPLIRFDGFSRKKYVEAMRDIWATVFGLTHVYHTKVGNDFVRGVSGGQRKRVSIAEAMVARGSVYCWDNATRGLDSSTALEYAQAIRTSTNLMKTSSFVTIYQAGENIYEVFDKVTVLYQGRQIYFGPADKAKQYFIDMGFFCPPRQATAEFLTAVTDPLGRTAREGFENKVPRTPAEFEQYWINSPEFAVLQSEIANKLLEHGDGKETKERFHENMLQEKMKYSSARSRYTVNFMEQIRLCTIRGAQNIIGDKLYSVTMVVAAIIQLLIVGSLFYDIPNSSSGIFGRGGTIFFAILYFALMTLAEVSSTFAERPIIAKQKGYSFYHPSANVLSYVVTQLPLKSIAITCFVLIVYFLTNLKRDAGAFFTHLLFINLNAQVVGSMFQMFASFVPTLAAANAISGVCMLACSLYSSYMIQRPSMVPWFKWFSYMDPILYGFESAITADFHGRHFSCDNLVPSGPGYENVSSLNQVCGFTASNGETFVDGDYYMNVSFSYQFRHVWRNFGILILFWIGFLALNCFAAENLKQIKETGDRLSFIKGARLPSSVLRPEDVDSASTSDPEKGPVEDSTIEGDIDNNRQENHIDTKLGSDEIFMWQHVDYVIQYEGADRKLLDDVQGFIKPGTLTALMGESGAGKTTLLNVLSQRVDMGVITGDMLVNGKPINSSFKRRTGYVQQQDVHVAELTVRESLQFAARLRRPASVPESEKLEYVEKVIEVLQMQDYADAVAGAPGTGLNVEQRKKLSIATEMVAKPELLLFLDEPTSGLDSQSAFAIVQIMRDLAQAGQLILCTIHQPSATLFEAFDRLLLLRKGGQTVYFGDIGENSSTIIDYFEGQGARKCEAKENPAEYILELIGAGATASVEENWYDKWVASEEFKNTTAEIELMIKETATKPDHGTTKEAMNTYAMPYFYQFKVVLLRTNLQFFRDLNYVVAKFMLILIAGLLIGFSYFNVKHTVIGMQNVLFACFIAIILSAPLANQIQGRAIESRELYEVRESKSNTFHWSTLLLSQYLVEIPYSIVFSTIFFICWYFPVQLDNEASRLGVWWLNYCIFFQFYYVSLSLFIVYFSPDLPSANVIISFFFNFIISFCCVVQPPSNMPGFWTFMWKASPYTYFVQSMVGVILHGRSVTCGPEEYAYLDPPEGQTCGEYLSGFLENNFGYVDNPDLTSQCGYCQYRNADEYMSTFSASYHYRWRNVGFYCVYIIFNVVAMLGLFYFFRMRTGSLLGSLKNLVIRKKK